MTTGRWRVTEALTAGRWYVDTEDEREQTFSEDDDGSAERLAAYLNALEAKVQAAGELMAALEKAHDRLDDHNASERKTTARCSWCSGYGRGDYDANGLLHDDDCVIVTTRQALDHARKAGLNPIV